ncbi:pyrroline-5-carboxylate reductase [Burkholderia contaminans]|uniref:Pyrroline-5-carboxylate reductase n=2 Tax=Burkholderia contaminans TaxID=488447 RepID=A0A3N8PTL0_9BURK|nr:pyrroline-5-carboxylate reductase [Burkholderia contaminans]
MAAALIEGMLRSTWDAARILVVEPDEHRRAWIASTFGVRTVSSGCTSLTPAKVVVWAVKPQVLRAAVEAVKSALGAPLHISICAGVSTNTFSRWIGSERVVRAMPNTPALVGAGVTALTALPQVLGEDRQQAESLMSVTGYSFWVDSDERVDAVTAISGSGPGYVFEFLACFQAAAQHLGFSEKDAAALAEKTAAGAIRQAATVPAAFETHRDRVMSRGGTTEAGLEVLSQHRLQQIIRLAVSAAYERARSLSQELDA